MLSVPIALWAQTIAWQRRQARKIINPNHYQAQKEVTCWSKRYWLGRAWKKKLRAPCQCGEKISLYKNEVRVMAKQNEAAPLSEIKSGAGVTTKYKNAKWIHSPGSRKLWELLCQERGSKRRKERGAVREDGVIDIAQPVSLSLQHQRCLSPVSPLPVFTWTQCCPQ